MNGATPEVAPFTSFLICLNQPAPSVFVTRDVLPPIRINDNFLCPSRPQAFGRPKVSGERIFVVVGCGYGDFGWGLGLLGSFGARTGRAEADAWSFCGV